MADVSEQMIWKGGLWIGIFVHRDYCRFTNDRSHLEKLCKSNNNGLARHNREQQILAIAEEED